MIRLSDADLAGATLAALERLAAALGRLPRRRPGESDRARRWRVIRAIQRWENEHAHGQHRT